MASDNRQETVEDVVEELRSNNGIPVPFAPNGYRAIWKDDCSNYADRIMAAWKRERAEIEAQALSIGGIVEAARHSPGNAAAMREACANIAEYARTARCHTDDAHVLGYLEQIEKWAESALSAPARQCDVGTALEQAQRFHDFCVGNSSGINGMCKSTCPCIDCFDKCQCLEKWAQTPYAAEEGAGE